MPRLTTGSIVPTRTKLGMSYGMRFMLRGQRVYHHFGGSWEGWAEERVEQERIRDTQVARGE